VQTPLGSLFRFGPFQVNSLSGELLKNGNRVKLQEQPFRLLVILLENAGEVVTHDDLCHRIWHDHTFVDFEGSLRVAVRKLREALGDDAENPRYVETIPKRGYRFLAPEIYSEVAHGIGELGASPSSAQIAAPDGGRISEPLVHRSNWSRRWMLTSVLLLIVAAGIAIAVRILRHPKVLTEKDTVVLADFANSTGDPVFDGTLRQGLSVQLEQSPFLSMVSEGRIQQTLKMMGQPADAKFTPGIAREVCQRMGSAAVLDGSIAQIGTRYLLTLQAVNCSNGDSLASTEAQASSKNDVLDTLGKTAFEMRNKLGESLGTVQKFDTPLEQATTTSLEALKAYSIGRKASAGSEWAAAVPFFQRAIRLDPNFSIAYARLGNCYRMLGEPTLAAENTRKAYELREPVSELEKFYIESHYYQQTTGELEKARQVYELWAQSYPRDWSRPSAETAVSAMQGRYDKGLIESLDEFRLNPNGDCYFDLLYYYLALNRLKEAQSTVEEAEAKGFDSPSIRNLVYQLHFLQNDAAGMSQQVAWATGKLGVEDGLLGLEADTAAYSGRLGRARDLSRQAVVSAKRAEEPERVAEYEADAALREALFGNPAEARERAADALGLSNSSSVQSLAALALAFAGDAVRARTLADDLANRFPDHTIVQSYKVPTIRAQLALSHDDPSGAIEILQAAVPYELSSEGALYPVYVRGEAYLAAHKGKEAAAEFQKIHDHSGIVVNSPIGALAHLGLGRAYALSGDKTKAKSAYQDFLALWKGADQDLPILTSAKREYAALR
jgi:DNA-binding winged helix-turn-helix (wHTH) protein/tetratricopeptide (TPR) repeat protein